MRTSFVVDLVKDPNHAGSLTRSIPSGFAQVAIIAILAVALPSDCLAQSNATSEPDLRAVASWPRFLGERYDGSVSQAADFDFSKPPEFLWSIELGAGYGICSVADGRVYQMDAGDPTPVRVQRGGARVERQRCFDLESGSQIWSKSESLDYQDLLGYEDGPRSSPTVVDDLVYTQGVSGSLTCRRTQDGAKVWSVDTNQKYGVVQNFFGVASAPLVVGERVYVMVGGSPPEDQNYPPMRLDRVTPNGSALVAFDRNTGEEIWNGGDDLASYSSPIWVTIEGQPTILLFARSGLMAFDPDDGKVRWQFPHRAAILESVNGIVPLVDGNQIFISECYEVGSVLLKAAGSSVKTVWQDPARNRRQQSMRCHWSTPVLVNGFLYGCSGRNAPDSDFRCVDWKTGKVMWNDARRIRSAVTRMGEYLLVLEERGMFQVLKANSEKLELVAQWDFSQPEGNRPALNYPCWSAPVVVGEKLLIRGDEHLICLKMLAQ